MRLVFLLLLNVFLVDQLLTEPIPMGPTVQTNQGVDGSKPNVIFIDDDSDQLNLVRTGNLNPLNVQLRRQYHDRRNHDPPNYTPERYLEMGNRNGGRVWYPGFPRSDTGHYY
ncbi:hypothetical protein Smp_103170 [Schistosoma mansoni]|uniref:hypothetical protein n=1 Tax=Schistosoma mansoni TaxID=6183 RepID=UPI0001A6255D|nr:hypothetical protein Smp_103170 [Schistosoma mansoni]|eukprot:XP_018644469.1 hypothetical protein Smp_103170 [Schistosoma mansoni]